MVWMATPPPENISCLKIMCLLLIVNKWNFSKRC